MLSKRGLATPHTHDWMMTSYAKCTVLLCEVHRPPMRNAFYSKSTPTKCIEQPHTFRNETCHTNCPQNAHKMHTKPPIFRIRNSESEPPFWAFRVGGPHKTAFFLQFSAFRRVLLFRRLFRHFAWEGSSVSLLTKRRLRRLFERFVWEVLSVCFLNVSCAGSVPLFLLSE
jgi:hypothetical protein